MKSFYNLLLNAGPIESIIEYCIMWELSSLLVCCNNPTSYTEYKGIYIYKRKCLMLACAIFQTFTFCNKVYVPLDGRFNDN